ncbi:ornithine cyclodeaminase [Thalassotalea insulae]|uniref:Ornithine cyclodeaminase n=1 Tax=Thalassotalea insulae TaxID=2056778 RepID=A0ABQ6GV39_9GAMM|nr:ornithine cyclodeaminase [Thalassotalea insulae]GLX79752.1 ornithine cyclodeaminase [Thalassotalea insulae]
MVQITNTAQQQNSSQVAFISVSQMMELVRHIGTENFITGLISYLEQDFSRWGLFNKSPRFAAHSPDGVIELMPTGDLEQFSFKYVNGHPKNPMSGLQTVTAFGVLSNVATGYPLLLSEMTILTALRTAATSAMAAKYLAPKNASTMAMIGCGAQSEFQVIAFSTVLGINKIRLYDIDPEAVAKCQKNLAGKDLEIVACQSIDQALINANIITTCTADKRNATILTNEQVADGVHINAIGGDCPGKTELEAKLLRRADIFVEYEAQTRIEGDIQQLAANSPVTELHRVINQQQPGREDENQLTIFDGVGFAIEDFSALRYVYQLAHKYDLYRSLELLANPSNPKDLYGLAMMSE